MSDVVSVVLPFVSVLLGGTITYVANVRDRRRGKVEDVFHDAIRAVAEAQATKDYVQLSPWRGASTQEVERLNAELALAGQRDHARAMNAAKVALARASAYDLALRVYVAPGVQTDTVLYAEADTIMARLRERIGS